MFARILASIAAALPSSLKYKLNWAKAIYTLAMSLGQHVMEVRTVAGTLYWEIDKLTSQQHILATYEPYMQRAFLKWVHSGSVVYDIGAHVSFHSLFCGLLVGSSGRVFAFEPGPEARASLMRQVAVNPGIPVTVLPYAISDRSGTAWLDTSRGSSQCFISDRGSIAVEARTIDALVMEGLPAPDVMKIDVEGHEKAVINGALDTLRTNNVIVLVDWNDATTLDTVRELLSPLGYSISEGPPIIVLPRVLPRWRETNEAR